MTEHIHPIFDKMLLRADKEKLLGQRGAVLWLTGLSGSGKSTIARGVEELLYGKGVLTKLLDGDNLRTGLNKNLGFSESDRQENIRRVAETARLFLDAGVVVLCSFVSPTRAIRAMAQEIIGRDDFYEVYIKASFDECARRDVKGLYAKALRGEIKNFTGLDAPFEEPAAPFLVVDTEKNSKEQSITQVFEAILPVISKQDETKL